MGQGDNAADSARRIEEIRQREIEALKPKMYEPEIDLEIRELQERVDQLERTVARIISESFAENGNFAADAEVIVQPDIPKELFDSGSLGAASFRPVIDDLTFRMYAALRRAVPGTFYRNDTFRPGESYDGAAGCGGCDAINGLQCYLLSNNYVVDRLAVHIVAFHRDDLSEEQLNIIRSLPAADVRFDLYEKECGHLFEDPLGEEDYS